jgi:hypothetical protein
MALFSGVVHQRIARCLQLKKGQLLLLLRVRMRSSCRQLFKTLHILPLPSVYIAETLIYVKKNINCYSKNSQIHAYNTRGKNDLHNIPHSTSLCSESFIHTSLQLYNTLPGHLKVMPPSKFKSQLQDLLHKYCFTVLRNLMSTFST